MASVRFLGLFPFCVRISEPQDEPFPKAYSAEMSIMDACKIFWRVKQWKLEFYVAREPFSADFSDTSFVDVAYVKTVNSETDLVCLGKDNSALVINKSDPALGQEDTWGFTLFADAIKSEGSATIRPQIIAFTGSPGDFEIAWNAATETLSVVDIGSEGSYLRMSPSKWWAYDPGDGRGPTYDEDTGARLF